VAVSGSTGLKASSLIKVRPWLTVWPNKERNREFELSRSDRFRYRTRYFADSGIIGSKGFVSENDQRFKHLFYSNLLKARKKAKTVQGAGWDVFVEATV